MTEKEKTILQDMVAFINFAIEEGMSFMPIIGTLAHDVDGVYQHWGWESQMFTDCFSPRTTGYRKHMIERSREKGLVVCSEAGEHDLCESDECYHRTPHKRVDGCNIPCDCAKHTKCEEVDDA